MKSCSIPFTQKPNLLHRVTRVTLFVSAFSLVGECLSAGPPFLRNLEVEGNLTVIDGRETLDGVVFYGAFDGLSVIPHSGPGTRFMWYPRKAALRGGQVTGTEWDEAEIGEFSVAMGLNPLAAGRSAVALGEGVGAFGDGSAAIGYNTSALGAGSFSAGMDSYADGVGAFAAGVNGYVAGPASVALGGDNTIFGGSGNVAVGSENWIDDGDRAFAIGHSNTIEFAEDSMAIGRENSVGGVSSMALGRNLENSVFSSLVVGSYNEPLDGGDDEWNLSDPLFIIGNGVSGTHRSNALVVRKSGDAELYGDLSVSNDVVVSGNLTVEGAFLTDIHLPDDLNVVGTVVADGGIASRGKVEAEDAISSRRSDNGNLMTAFAGHNEADQPGSGVRIALSNAPEDSEDSHPGASVDAVLQPDGSHDLVFSSASVDGLNEILRLRGAGRSTVIEGDTYVNGDVVMSGEVTIAHVPPQGGIMMGEFGFTE